MNKNKEGLLNLASLLSSFRDEYFDKLLELYSKVSKIKIEEVEGVDATNELRLGLNEIYLKLSEKLERELLVSWQGIERVDNIIVFLLEDRASYFCFLNRVVNNMIFPQGYELSAKRFTDMLIKYLVLEAFCDDENVLEKNQMDVIQLFEGLSGKKSKPLDEISKMLGITREKARQRKELASIKIWKVASKIQINYTR